MLSKTLLNSVRKSVIVGKTNFSIFRPRSMRLGWSKELVDSVIPYTSQILSSRGRSFEDIAVRYCAPQPPHDVSPESGVGFRYVEDSWLELVLPFPDRLSLRDGMSDIDGSTVLYGKLFEVLDAFAADVAYRHACDPSHFREESERVAIVTASVDKMINFSTINIHEELRLQGYVSYVGKTSMEVCVDIIRVPKEDVATNEYNSDQSPTTTDEILSGSIHFIMVARQPGNQSKSMAVHQLHGLGDHSNALKQFALDVYKQRYANGLQRGVQRKSESKVALSVAPPKAEEVNIIHQLYLTSKALKQQRNMYLMGLSVNKSDDRLIENVDNDIEKVKVFLSQLQTGSMRWMSHTKMKNILLMYPQSRNVHCRVFGGYIMRSAFELAQVTAMCFYGDRIISAAPPSSTVKSTLPIFLAVDEVQFVRPLSIGAITEFESMVIYTRDAFSVIQVHVHEVEQQTGKKTLTNKLIYVFSSKPVWGDVDVADNEQVGMKVSPQTMPREYDEFILYLEGKRCLDRLLQVASSHKTPQV